jgi:predicted ester cyclase
MSVEENKAIVRRMFEEVQNKGNLVAADELIATNYIDHNPISPGLAPGLEGIKQGLALLREAMPDLWVTIEDMVAEGDKVTTRVTARFTHKGEFMGIAPTGKQVTIPGISIMRIADGKIVEEWTSSDQLGMMMQLGVIPPLGQGKKG